jgi:hypothetical protein
MTKGRRRDRQFEWKGNIKSGGRKKLVVWGALELGAGGHMTPVVGGPQFEFDDGRCHGISPAGDPDGYF